MSKAAIADKVTPTTMNCHPIFGKSESETVIRGMNGGVFPGFPLSLPSPVVVGPLPEPLLPDLVWEGCVLEWSGRSGADENNTPSDGKSISRLCDPRGANDDQSMRGGGGSMGGFRVIPNGIFDPRPLKIVILGIRNLNGRIPFTNCSIGFLAMTGKFIYVPLSDCKHRRSTLCACSGIRSGSYQRS